MSYEEDVPAIARLPTDGADLGDDTHSVMSDDDHPHYTPGDVASFRSAKSDVSEQDESGHTNRRISAIGAVSNLPKDARLPLHGKHTSLKHLLEVAMHYGPQEAQRALDAQQPTNTNDSMSSNQGFKPTPDYNDDSRGNTPHSPPDSLRAMGTSVEYLRGRSQVENGLRDQSSIADLTSKLAMLKGGQQKNTRASLTLPPTSEETAAESDNETEPEDSEDRGSPAGRGSANGGGGGGGGNTAFVNQIRLALKKNQDEQNNTDENGVQLQASVPLNATGRRKSTRNSQNGGNRPRVRVSASNPGLADAAAAGADNDDDDDGGAGAQDDGAPQRNEQPAEAKAAAAEAEAKPAAAEQPKPVQQAAAGAEVKQENGKVTAGAAAASSTPTPTAGAPKQPAGCCVIL